MHHVVVDIVFLWNAVWWLICVCIVFIIWIKGIQVLLMGSFLIILIVVVVNGSGVSRGFGSTIPSNPPHQFFD